MQIPNSQSSKKIALSSKANKEIQSQPSENCNGISQLITKMAKDLASQVNIEINTINDWIEFNQGLPNDHLLHLLKMAKHYSLNPNLGHIGYEQDEKGIWQIFITVDGWITLLHQQKNFAGIAFEEANELEAGVPVWMQCSIYRNDKSIPITVKEYFCEVRSDHAVWQETPRRMLRHKALQQCIKLAFGISGYAVASQAGINKSRIINNQHQNKKKNGQKLLLKKMIEESY